ncbi:hypothetical protein BGW80DRAFT_294149 [Lactifluus volemus]|nr:hypothetical protein BGW80DRAFT_294149 [Lactifluus volemus]
MLQLWWLCVVFPCCRCFVLCVQTHVPIPPLSSPPIFFFSFSCRACCGADGDRVLFFFIHCIYIDPAQSKSLSKPLTVACTWYSCLVVSYSRTPGCKLPKGWHSYMVKNPFFIRSMYLSIA